jgi:1-deoxy-D-xylulose-5-phosphate synthase
MVTEIANNHSHVITVEDGAIAGGFGEAWSEKLYRMGFTGSMQHLGIPNAFITHGSNEQLYDICGYSPNKIADAIKTALNEAADPVVD